MKPNQAKPKAIETTAYIERSRYLSAEIIYEKSISIEGWHQWEKLRRNQLNRRKYFHHTRKSSDSPHYPPLRLHRLKSAIRTIPVIRKSGRPRRREIEAPLHIKMTSIRELYLHRNLYSYVIEKENRNVFEIFPSENQSVMLAGYRHHQTKSSPSSGYENQKRSLHSVKWQSKAPHQPHRNHLWRKMAEIERKIGKSKMKWKSTENQKMKPKKIDNLKLQIQKKIGRNQSKFHQWQIKPQKKIVNLFIRQRSLVNEAGNLRKGQAEGESEIEMKKAHENENVSAWNTPPPRNEMKSVIDTSRNQALNRNTAKKQYINRIVISNQNNRNQRPEREIEGKEVSKRKHQKSTNEEENRNDYLSKSFHR